MIKWVFSFLILTFALPVFSKELSQDSEAICLHNESLSLIYLWRGNEHLMHFQNHSALKDFDSAYFLAEESGLPNTELKFLIYFGKAIAYDNLEMHAECRNVLASLFLCIEDAEDDNAYGQQDYQENDYAEADKILRELANLAHSPQVQDLLTSLLDKMFEEVSPMFKIAGLCGMESDWEYDMHNHGSARLCKTRFWKKLEKMAKKHTTLQ